MSESSFIPQHFAFVNTTDGTITSTGVTTPDQPAIPKGATALSSDQWDTVEAAQQDGAQCRLIGGVVRISPVASPAPIDLDVIRAAAYVQIDAGAEAARALFLTGGSGQALEYQQTSADAERLLTAFGLMPGPVTGFAAARTEAPWIAGTQPLGVVQPGLVTPLPSPDPADYPWLAAEQQALASIGVAVSLIQVALSVHQLMEAWAQAGAAIKEVRRSAKLRVSLAADGPAISAIVQAIAWPRLPNLATSGAIPGT